MPEITFVQVDKTRVDVEIAAGITLMVAAVMNDVAGILAECGGSCICGTCHVLINERDLALVFAQKYVWLGNRDADDRNRHFFVRRIGPRAQL
jgi:ferredoxin